MGKFGDDPGAIRYVINGLRMKMPPRLTFPIPYAKLFTDNKDRTIFRKAMTKRGVCRTFYRESPEGVGGEQLRPMLRGTDGKQTNMASEQRTELWA